MLITSQLLPPSLQTTTTLIFGKFFFLKIFIIFVSSKPKVIVSFLSIVISVESWIFTYLSVVIILFQVPVILRVAGGTPIKDKHVPWLSHASPSTRIHLSLHHSRISQAGCPPRPILLGSLASVSEHVMVSRNQDLSSPCILLLKCQCFKLLSEDRARETHTHNISWACWGKNTLLYFSLTHTLTMLLTPVVWVFHTASISLSPAGCPITHSSFGTTYTVLASDPTSERLSHTSWGFPQNSVGKESACNAGDPGSIPGLGRSPGEG